MISKREREPSSSFEGSEEDQRERRRTFDIELILWGTNSDHSGDRSPPESVTTREITKLKILVVAAERSSVLVLARALQSLAVRRLVCIPCLSLSLSLLLSAEEQCCVNYSIK